MTTEVVNMFDKGRLNQDLADKLRKDHPLQLITLVRMHLSFLLDLNCLNDTDADSAEKLKQKKNWLFHKKKASVCTSTSNKSPETNLPIMIPEMMKQMKILIDFLQRDENLKQEGLFRKTGSISRQQQLKFLINQLKPFELDQKSEYSAHDCASVLKSILSDLPEPILSEAHFPAYSQIADRCNSKENDDEEKIMTSLQLLILLLPQENRIILESLVLLLHKASKHEAHNKMTSDTLATLFTPHLICPRKLSPEVLHQTAATMTRMISFMITNAPTIFLVPEKLATDIKAYLIEEKRRKETPDKILDESSSDSIANTVFTFCDIKKTAEAHGNGQTSATDTALAQLYAHIQSLPESSKRKKLIKQFNKQNGQGTPLQYLNRDKPHSACRSIGDSIKKHIFLKTLHKTPKFSSTNTPSSSKITRTPSVQIHPNKRLLFKDSPALSNPSTPTLTSLQDTPSTSTSSSAETPQVLVSNKQVTCTETSKSEAKKIDDTPAIPIVDNLELSNEEMIDDEDFVDSSDEEIEEDQNDDKTKNTLEIKNAFNRNLLLPMDETMEHKSLLSNASSKKSAASSFRSRLMKGVSLGNLKFPFHSSSTTPKNSPKLKKSKSSSILIDIEKEDGLRKFVTKSDTESFNSSEESDMFFSMDHTKESWHVDVSNINYFLNQTGMQEHPGVRNSMSPITKSTQRMPKSMQESIMTPRSRKPVMITMFGNLDQKSYQANISQLLEESEEIINENDVPTQEIALPTISENATNTSLNAANDNGLPIAENASSSNSSGSLSSPFIQYLSSRGHFMHDNDQDDYSFSSQSDDFESSNEYQKLEESSENVEAQEMEIEKVINQSSLSRSMLHCLDGNDASLLATTPNSSCENVRKRNHEKKDDNSVNDNDDDSPSQSMKRPLIENF